MADRYDELTPNNLVVTLRSLRRRFDSVSGAVRSDPKLLDRADLPGADGDSLIDIFDRTMRAVSMLGGEATRICTHTEPVVTSAAFDPTSWIAESGHRATLRESTDVIATTAEELADLLERQEPTGWLRTAERTGGGQVDLITVVRSIVRQAIEGLRRAERQLERIRA
jgi:hypothetical protein